MGADGTSAPLLEAQGITKHFGAFTALDGVDFALSGGEIHALLGENGAGKSTLMNVLSGLLRPTAGEILLDGGPVRFSSPADAERSGIGMVHQHFLLVPPLSVRENLLLGAARENRRSAFLPVGSGIGRSPRCRRPIRVDNSVGRARRQSSGRDTAAGGNFESPGAEKPVS